MLTQESSVCTNRVIWEILEIGIGRVGGGNLSSNRVEGHKIENVKRSQRNENSITVRLCTRYPRCLLSTIQPDTSSFSKDDKSVRKELRHTESAALFFSRRRRDESCGRKDEFRMLPDACRS